MSNHSKPRGTDMKDSIENPSKPSRLAFFQDAHKDYHRVLQQSHESFCLICFLLTMTSKEWTALAWSCDSFHFITTEFFRSHRASLESTTALNDTLFIEAENFGCDNLNPRRATEESPNRWKKKGWWTMDFVGDEGREHGQSFEMKPQVPLLSTCTRAEHKISWCGRLCSTKYMPKVHENEMKAQCPQILRSKSGVIDALRLSIALGLPSISCPLLFDLNTRDGEIFKIVYWWTLKLCR